MWKQEVTRYPKCPHCGEELDTVVELAYGSAVVLMKGQIVWEWDGENLTQIVDEHWEDYDRRDFESEGRDIYLCPHCHKDVTDIVRERLG